MSSTFHHISSPVKIALALLLLPWIAYAQTYVAPTGSDANSGSIDAPYATVTKALTVAGPDSTIYVRGGLYHLSSSINVTKNGASGHYLKIWAYPGEHPVFDFATQGSSDGFSLKGSYIHLKGIEATHAYHNGINVSGNNNIIENCIVHENRNSGFQMGSQNATPNPANNLILNCDSYLNFDGPVGGNADGYAVKWNIGPGNVFRGCRAWNNSDDGWDLWMAVSSVEIDSCMSFRNGVDSWHTGSVDGNGNGFKLGGNNVPTPHTVKNCVAFDNAGNTGRGFDENNNLAGQTLYNCTSYRNTGANFGFYNTLITGQHVVKNCISYRGIQYFNSGTLEANSWQLGTVSDVDFLSLDTALAVEPRNEDGSLPSTAFLHLVSTDWMVNAGVDVGTPFNGPAPDLGAYETNPAAPYILSVHSPHGTVVKDPNMVSYANGASVQLTASPSVYYAFAGWSGDVSGSINPITVVMDGNKYVEAMYTPTKVTLSVSTVGSGSVTRDPNLSLYSVDTTVTLTAIPQAGWVFSGWSGDTSSIDNPFTVVMSGNKNIIATFVGATYTITATAGPHGSILYSGAVIVPYLGTQRFRFLPEVGYYVETLLVDGVNVPDSTSYYTFRNVNTNHTIHAGFALNPVGVNDGWNMVSLPVATDDPRKSVLFPTAISPAYTFQNGYITRDSMVNGVGYWLKFTGPQTVPMNGTTILQASIPIVKGWNMIGSISIPVPVTAITSASGSVTLSSFFNYQDGYVITDTIVPGRAYWVRADKADTLMFHNVIISKGRQ